MRDNLLRFVTTFKCECGLVRCGKRNGLLSDRNNGRRWCIGIVGIHRGIGPNKCRVSDMAAKFDVFVTNLVLNMAVMKLSQRAYPSLDLGDCDYDDVRTRYAMLCVLDGW